MDYTVIYSAPVQTVIEPMIYKFEGADTSSEAYFVPINSILASKIENDSNVRVVVLESQRDGIDTNSIVERCTKETNSVLKDKNCNIEFVIISNPFSASKENMGKIFMDLIQKPIEDSTILTDITYGPKYVPMLIFCLLSYAERFLGCEISNVIYGQVFFDKDKKPYNPQIFDVASLYLLSSFSRFFGNSKDDYDSFLKGFFK